MALTFYNTLTKQKEEFKPIEQGKVGLYTCGPTVYDYLHIGNLRAYIFADTLRRHLEVSGYEVRMIKNITDVGHLTDDDVAQGDSGEDKMLKKARQEKKDPYEIARFYENAAIEDENELNILVPQFRPRATEHVSHMIEMIERLIARGFAYESNGFVFMDVARVDGYGALSGNTLDQLEVGARLEDPHPEKRSQWDFALWHKAGPEHLMRWESPWSTGYPGWHIECSAMSLAYLGATFDIHTGGEDNIFPHHEAEIAQSESCSAQKFVNYWMHTRHLLVDGAKMSKSKGTGYTLADIKEKGYDAMDLRMLYLMSHYRSQMNFTWDAMHQARQNRLTLERFLKRIEVASGEGLVEIDTHAARSHIMSAMDDDLNTPEVITHIFAFVTEVNKSLDGEGVLNISEVRSLFTSIVGDILGLTFNSGAQENVPQNVIDLAHERKSARDNKDFETSDRLRDEIAALGYVVTDDSSENGFSFEKR